MGSQLHNRSIDEREYALHESRRGRRYAYENLDPERTALIVVDMVPLFAGARSFGDVRPTADVIELISRRP